MAAANLITLMDDLVNVSYGWINQPDFSEPSSLFDRLDHDFPLPFLPWTNGEPEASEWGLKFSHIKMAIEVRTQRLILHLRQMKQKKKKLSPVRVAATVFCGSRVRAEAALDAMLNGPYVDLLNMTVAPESAVYELCQDRARVVVKAMGSSKSVANVIQPLEEAFPLEPVVQELYSWADEHFRKIQQAIKDEKRPEATREETPGLFVSEDESQSGNPESIAPDEPAPQPAANTTLG
jgi:hypothetical protein